MSKVSEYQSMKNVVMGKFMDRTFYKAWATDNFKKEDVGFFSNYKSVEFILNKTCDLDCKYCYVKKHGDEYFPVNHTKKTILKNIGIFCDFLIDNDYHPMVELFGGDVLSQSIGFDVLDLLLKKTLKDGLKLNRILIPTNSSFLMNNSKVEKIEYFMREFKKVNSPLFLSLSIDGKYMDENRPFVKKGKERTDEYYDTAFRFAKKHGLGFHPMIYSSNIESWTKNFLWFQDMFAKHDMPWNSIYLLEVRNKEWSDSQVSSFNEFIDFLIRWVWDKVGHSWNEYWKFLRNGKGFNILSSPWMSIGRGIGCSIQSTLYIRSGDLTFSPCHRLMYDNLTSGKFKVVDGKISGVEAYNLEMYLAVNSLDSNTFPMCDGCLINKFCSKGCLGAQYEVNGDPFVPIPTVCMLEHAKIFQMIKTMKNIGIIGFLEDILPAEMSESIRLIKEELWG